MLVLGFLSAIIMGLILGLIGGGGSILTVPILVYIMGFGAVQATAYSLFLVGITSLFGALTSCFKRQVNSRYAFFFGLPSIGGVYWARRFLMPNLPDYYFLNTPFAFSKNELVLVIFALVMLMASFSMIRSSNIVDSTQTVNKEFKTFDAFVVICKGVFVGILTGFVGAGGGFLIVPFLIFAGGLPMRVAIGTSLLIISVKSLVGFIGDLNNINEANWPFLLTFSVFSLLGIIVGVNLSDKFSNQRLKLIFGWFILVMALCILFTKIF